MPKLNEALRERPQVILMPLRLGAEHLNISYSSLMKVSLSCKQSLGIIGGRASRAFYIVGYQDDSLLYLDPHFLRPACNDLDRIISNREYHTRAVCELALPSIDPTILFCYICFNQTDADSLAKTLLGVNVPMPLFSVISDGAS